MKFRAALTLMAAALLSACGLNSVPTAEENAKAKFADLQAAYQRRADLLKNLENIVTSSAKAERGTLTEVVEARAKATSVQINAGDLTDPAKVAAFQQAQSQLNSGVFGRLLSVSEAYPDLKSQDNYKTAIIEYEGSNNRITIAIRDYNAAVQAYNTRIRTFPDAIGAKVFYGAKPMAPFQADPGAKDVPTIFKGQ